MLVPFSFTWFRKISDGLNLLEYKAGYSPDVTVVNSSKTRNAMKKLNLLKLIKPRLLMEVETTPVGRTLNLSPNS